MYSSPIYQQEDFLSIAEHYAKLTDKDAIIIPYGWEPSLDYYSQKMDFKARFIEIPLHTSAETVVQRLTSELQGVQHVEVLTWFQLPADVRGAFPCILSTIATKTDVTLTTSGLRTDRYEEVSAARITTVNARSLRFGNAQMSAHDIDKCGIALGGPDGGHVADEPEDETRDPEPQSKSKGRSKRAVHDRDGPRRARAAPRSRAGGTRRCR